MARHLDLEEQEQLDELKHFWKQYGNLVTWMLIAVFASYAAWNGWNWWQRDRAARASVLYEEVDRAVAAGDTARVKQAFGDMKDKFGGTIYAQQAGLLAARGLADKGEAEPARAALQWVAEEASDEGYQAIAKLRLAALQVEARQYDQALQLLAGDFPASFQSLAADRRGDIYQLQGKKAEARAEYTKAWQALAADSPYRPLLEVKLTALGVDVASLKAAPAATRS